MGHGPVLNNVQRRCLYMTETRRARQLDCGQQIWQHKSLDQLKFGFTTAIKTMITNRIVGTSFQILYVRGD